ncbi:hypothetical protein ACTQ6A_13970 [Lachnospiraceae bacterium LCP25S3_G4]
MDIFKLVGSIFVDNSKANESIQKTDEKASGLGNKFLQGVGTAAKWGAGVVAAAGAGAVALGGVAIKAAGAMDEIDKGSAKIGISKQAYQEWGYVLGQNGMDISKLEVGMKTLVSSMDGAANGTKSAQEKFDALGLSVFDANGNLKDQETMMNETMYALANMENGTEKARLATELFGKSGVEMMPMLNGGAAGMEELTQRAHDLGLVVSDDAVTAGVVLGDTIDDVKQAFEAIVNKIGIAVMPIFQEFLDWILSHMPEIQTVISAVFDVIGFIVTAVFGKISEFFSILDGILSEKQISFSLVVEFLKAIMLDLFTVIQTIWNTIGKPVFDFISMAVSLVASYFAQKMPEIKEFFAQAVTDIKAYWDTNLKPCLEAIGSFINNVLAPAFKYVFNNIIVPVVDACFNGIKSLWNNSLKPILTGITDFLTGIFTLNFTQAFSGIVEAVKGIFGGIVSVVKTPINAVIGIVNKFIDSLNQLKVPDWVPGIGGNGVNIGHIPLLAKGGTILGSGKAIVGEAGPELLDLPAGARVQPLGAKSTLNDDRLAEIMQAVLSEIRFLNENLYEMIVDALVNGVSVDVDSREIIRVVRKYA